MQMLVYLLIQTPTRTGKAYQVDVTDNAAIEAALEQSIRDLNNRIDIFVINSGIAWVYGPTIDSDPEKFARVLDTNYTSLYRCARAVGPHFKRQTAEKTDLNGRPLQNYTSGSLVATSSLGATREQVPNPQAPYNAAKAAMSGFCRGLAVEWVKFARVNAVSPGYVMTDILAPAPEHWLDVWTGRIPMGRTGKVHEMKGAYLFLASDASTFATGMEMVVDGGVSSGFFLRDRHANYMLISGLDGSTLRSRCHIDPFRMLSRPGALGQVQNENEMEK